MVSLRVSSRWLRTELGLVLDPQDIKIINVVDLDHNLKPAATTCRSDPTTPSTSPNHSKTTLFFNFALFYLYNLLPTEIIYLFRRGG